MFQVIIHVPWIPCFTWNFVNKKNINKIKKKIIFTGNFMNKFSYKLFYHLNFFHDNSGTFLPEFHGNFFNRNLQLSFLIFHESSWKGHES